MKTCSFTMQPCAQACAYNECKRGDPMRAMAAGAGLWERRNGTRNLDGTMQWHSWLPCSEAEAQRVTGLRSWQARQVTIGRPVPEEVRRAIERMSTPLHPSWGAVARGATAAGDAHSMAVIRAFVLGEDLPVPTDGPISVQDLHRRIMNIQAKPYDGSTTYDAYCRGHKDARHAAAEVAMAFDDGMRAAMVKLSRALGNPKDVDAGATQSLEAALIELAADRLTQQPTAMRDRANGVRPDGVTAVAPTPTKACPECGGEGICYRTQALDDCTACNGTGRVPDGVKEGGDA